ncbi:MAG: hypothetical protein HYU76_03645 [Betaproteobacteria bacterium]|nr:hypothetical protein [Betaproteobacteria bacterium]
MRRRVDAIRATLGRGSARRAGSVAAHARSCAGVTFTALVARAVRPRGSCRRSNRRTQGATHTGRTDDTTLSLLRVPAATALRKVPCRTEYQRGILARDDKGEWVVRITGQQGPGVLRSMSEANCFIVLEHGRGEVEAGELVQVQLFDGLT